MAKRILASVCAAALAGAACAALPKGLFGIATFVPPYTELTRFDLIDPSTAAATTVSVNPVPAGIVDNQLVYLGNGTLKALSNSAQGFVLDATFLLTVDVPTARITGNISTTLPYIQSLGSPQQIAVMPDVPGSFAVVTPATQNTGEQTPDWLVGTLNTASGAFTTVATLSGTTYPGGDGFTTAIYSPVSKMVFFPSQVAKSVQPNGLANVFVNLATGASTATQGCYWIGSAYDAAKDQVVGIGTWTNSSTTGELVPSLPESPESLRGADDDDTPPPPPTVEYISLQRQAMDGSSACETTAVLFPNDGTYGYALTNSLAFDPASRTLFAMATTSNNPASPGYLISINADTGAFTFVNTTSGQLQPYADLFWVAD